MKPLATGEGIATAPEPPDHPLTHRPLTCHAPAAPGAMKAARIALRSAAPLAGASAGSSSSRLPQEVEQFSRFSPSPLSIKQLLDFGESGEEQGEVGAGRQPEPGARRVVSPRRGEPGGCRGRGCGGGAVPDRGGSDPRPQGSALSHR